MLFIISRRSALTLLWLTLVGGSINAQSPVAFPLKASADGRHFVDRRGRPFFYHADSAWQLAKKLSPAEVAEYLDRRKAQGFSAIQMQAFSAEVTPMQNRDGQAPFEPERDILKPNEKYWRNVDDVLRAAWSRGLLVSFAPLWLRWGGEDKAGWRYQLTDDNARLYGRFLGRRYKGFDNLMWILGGDANPIERTRAVAEIARGIQEAGARQLITVHNRPEYSSSAFFEGEPWLGVNAAYSYRETYIHVLGEWNRLSRPRPIFLSESGYEDESNDRRGGTAFRMRRQVYGAILSGALGGHAFGHKNIWRFDERWRDSLDTAATRQMAFCKALFAGRAWYKLAPDQFDQLVTSGRDYFGRDEYAPAALAADRSFALVYLPTPRRITVNLKQLKGAVRASWFDPTDGSYRQIEGPALTGERQFSPPDKNAAGEGDFVLVLEAG